MRGLGIDLCGVERIERELKRSDAFLRRFFTNSERAYIASRGQMGAQSAAAMFAAKEAFLKAVGAGVAGGIAVSLIHFSEHSRRSCRSGAGAGIGGGIALDEIGVEHLPGGAPAYRLTGTAQARLGELGAERAFLSLTHEAGMAAAVCVIE